MFLLLYNLLTRWISGFRLSACPDEIANSKGSKDQDQKFHFDLLWVLPGICEQGTDSVMCNSGLWFATL
jgi:hypothetical protein